MSYIDLNTKPLTPANEPARQEFHETDPAPYQGVKYDRSQVKFARVPVSALMERGCGDSLVYTLLDLLPEGAFIAGGAVAALVNGTSLAADCDIFFANAPALVKTLCALGAKGFKVVEGDSVPSGVIQFSREPYKPVQVINICWFPGGIEEVLDGFDYTCTQFGIDTATRDVVFNPFAPLDYQARRLVEHRAESDTSFKKRLTKYMTKGFRPVGTAYLRAKKLGLITDRKVA